MTADVSRRAVLGLAAVAAAMGAGLVPWGSAEAQRRGGGLREVSLEEMMKGGPLPDIVLGKPDAPVTIIEYASMTCGHCAAFHKRVLPELKAKYIDTGKAKLILREFPLNDEASAGFMLARCAPPQKHHAVVGALFDKLDEWYVPGNSKQALFKLARQLGFTQDSFEKCLTDQALLDKIQAVREHASEKFGVSSTPTFFVNGKPLRGGFELADFDKAIAAAQK